MHLHLKESVLNYGPVYGFWCFPFERFNGVLESFQKNWISSELQMLKKFITYQDLNFSDLPSTLPPELNDFFTFQLSMNGKFSARTSDGSIELSHADPFSLLEYQNNVLCPLSEIDATENSFYSIHRRFEKFLDSTEVSWLSVVYCFLYP